MQKFSFKVDSDVVKDEAANRYSRDEGTLASGSGALQCGAVLAIDTATGKYKPFAPAASDGTQKAAGILLHVANATAVDVTVIVLKRHAQVVDQALVWPEGITPTQKATALRELHAAGIVPRNGV